MDSLVRIICTNLLFSAVRVYVCSGGGGSDGGPINLSTKIEQTRIRIMYHNVALNDWCEKIIGELFYCKLQIVI